MATQNYPLPPSPALPTIHPWEGYNATLVIQWLYAQAQRTGFSGTLEDFKQRYGTIIEAADPHDIYDLIENYSGPYRITPLENIEQVLKTNNKIVNRYIIVEAMPSRIEGDFTEYKGRYEAVPMANFDQYLRTKNKVLLDDITVEKIPYSEVSNTAGGTTVIIG